MLFLFCVLSHFAIPQCSLGALVAKGCLFALCHIKLIAISIFIVTTTIADSIVLCLEHNGNTASEESVRSSFSDINRYLK